MNYNIMHIGFMGVGKTTVSKELSKKLGMPEVDMASYIVEHEKMEIKDIFEQYGEEYFRKVETNCLAEVQKSKGKIVSCGGGAVLKDENVKLMKDGGIILLLTATPETVYNRVKDNNDRPILNGNMNVAMNTTSLIFKFLILKIRLFPAKSMTIGNQNGKVNAR